MSFLSKSYSVIVDFFIYLQGSRVDSMVGPKILNESSSLTSGELRSIILMLPSA